MTWNICSMLSPFSRPKLPWQSELMLLNRGYSCYRLNGLDNLSRKFIVCSSWGKYPNESKWKLGRVRIMKNTPLLLVPLDNTNNFYRCCGVLPHRSTTCCYTLATKCSILYKVLNMLPIHHYRTGYLFLIASFNVWLQQTDNNTIVVLKVISNT